MKKKSSVKPVERTRRERLIEIMKAKDDALATLQEMTNLNYEPHIRIQAASLLLTLRHEDV